MSKTILSDFDGVLTNQINEALRVQEIAQELIASRSGAALSEVQKAWNAVKKDIHTKSHAYGWKMSGRLSAFCNEDLFIEGMGVAQWFDELKDFNFQLQQKEISSTTPHFSEPMIKQLKTIDCFGSISQEAYGLMTKETSAGKHKPLEEEGIVALGQWLRDGFQVVIVSNSETARIEEMLKKAELFPHSKLKVMGGARKFELGPDADTIAIGKRGEYQVDRNRPKYLEILEGVKPHFVIGDVFSLDLALPLKLEKAGKIPLEYGILVQRDYTPDWVKQDVSKTFGAKLQQVKKLPARV